MFFDLYTDAMNEKNDANAIKVFYTSGHYVKGGWKSFQPMKGQIKINQPPKTHLAVERFDLKTTVLGKLYY